MSPMNRLAYMAGVMVAAAADAMISFTAVFIIGLAFGIQIASFNAPLFLSSLLLTAFALFGIGLMANAITLTFRDRTTTANSLTILFMVFSGIVCPIELMPQWAQLISNFLPLTYGIRLMRVSLIGIKTYNITHDLVILSILGAIYIAIGALTLRLIERNLKKKALFSVF
jgi:ABC-2 type transport system permease protein